MTVNALYADTSALAKIYVPEKASDAVEACFQKAGSIFISDLTVVELRCLLTRRTRTGELPAHYASKAYAAFVEQVQRRHYQQLPIDTRHFCQAHNLIDLLPTVPLRTPLRTLDALHLAVASDNTIGRIATADKVFADAATALGMACELF